MTPHFDVFLERKSISKKWTFGNKSHLQVFVSGVIKLKVQEKDKAVEVGIKDVLWVSELPCRQLSTGSVRRQGGGSVDSGTRKNQIN